MDDQSPEHSFGREADPEFAESESLYRRVRPDFVVGGILSPAALSFEETSGLSVNRSKFSRPEDVLHPDCCHGTTRSGYLIFSVAVRDIPKHVLPPDGQLHRFFLKHQPEETCYAHSEIRCNTADGSTEVYKHRPKGVRHLFRARLSQAFKRV